jgi:methionyl-tRNA synthetase
MTINILPNIENQLTSKNKKSQHGYNTLNCCKYASNFIILNYDIEKCKGKNLEYFKTHKPNWVICTGHPIWDNMDDVDKYLNIKDQIFYCPYCATLLPKIRLIDDCSYDENEIRLLSDNGWYCNTCQKQIRDCKCLQPENLWTI